MAWHKAKKFTLLICVTGSIMFTDAFVVAVDLGIVLVDLSTRLLVEFLH